MRIEMRALAALLVIVWPGTASAGDQFAPYASAQTEHNSNLFARSEQPTAVEDINLLPGVALPGQEPVVTQNGDTTPSETVQRYIAGVGVNLPWGNQKLRAAVEGRRLEFDRFSELNHDEYLLNGGLDWRLTSSGKDGVLDYRKERRQASFQDRNSTALTLEDERAITASFNQNLSPDWRLETGLRSRQLGSPLPDFPEFQLKENAVNGALEYLLVESLSAGVFAEYLTGRFEGVPDAHKFHQENVAVTTDYPNPGFGRISAQLGYTQRRDEDSGDGELSALTGLLNYFRELTGKTSADLRAFRRVRSDVRGANSVVENGAGTTLVWAATHKISLAGAYEFTQGRFGDEFQETGSSSTSRSGNREDTQTASLTLTYQALRWLAVRGHGGYQERDSDNPVNTFDAVTAGIELQVTLQ